MGRLSFLTAARGAVVLLLTTTIITGFSEPGDMTPGTSVAATPTVGITGGASPNGTQVSGEIVALDNLQTPSVAMLSTTAGFVYVLITEPAMAKALRIGTTVTFSGQYLSADWFQAQQIVNGADGGDVALGAPVGTSGPVKLGAPLGKSATSGSSGSNTDPTKTPTPTPGKCSNSKKLTLDPQNGSAVIGKSYKVLAGISFEGDCEGKQVYLQVLSGPNSAVSPVHATVDDDQHASLSYIGTSTGTDTILVWLDISSSNGSYDSGEVHEGGTVTWAAPTATPTPTNTSVPTAATLKTTRTPTPTSTSKPTKTPTLTATAVAGNSAKR